MVIVFSLFASKLIVLRSISQVSQFGSSVNPILLAYNWVKFEESRCLYFLYLRVLFLSSFCSFGLASYSMTCPSSFHFLRLLFVQMVPTLNLIVFIRFFSILKCWNYSFTADKFERAVLLSIPISLNIYSETSEAFYITKINYDFSEKSEFLRKFFVISMYSIRLKSKSRL